MSLAGKLLKPFLPEAARPVRVAGRPLWLSPRKDFHLYRLALAGRLAPASEELSAALTLMGFMTPGSTFVDVGANVGLFAAVFASVGERAGFDVTAIEPDPDTVGRLRKTLEPYGNCRVIACACSDRDGEAALIRTGDSLTSMLGTERNAVRVRRFRGRRASEPVALRRLDSLFAGGTNRLVLKIDVEGHEREALAGAEGLFAAGRVAAVLIDETGREEAAWLEARGFERFDGLDASRRSADSYTSLFVRQPEAGARA